MAFDFDVKYVKGNTIPHVYTLSWLWFKVGLKLDVLALN